jgi:DNA-binding SARP family transcriptional activator
MAGARLHLLEGFSLQSQGQPVDLPVGVQRLLAFLALRGPAPRAVVAGILWPEVPDSQALASLRTGIWRLHKLVPDAVCVEGLAMAVTMPVDCREQEAFSTRVLREHPDDTTWVREGLPTLWQRELLPGWYDDWVVFERERLSQLRLHALEHTAQLLIQERDLDTALQLALEAVRTEPLRETATAVLMSVYLAEGNVADAIRQRDVFADLLQRELGLEPSPALSVMAPQPRRPRVPDRVAAPRPTP